MQRLTNLFGKKTTEKRLWKTNALNALLFYILGINVLIDANRLQNRFISTSHSSWMMFVVCMRVLSISYFVLLLSYHRRRHPGYSTLNYWLTKTLCFANLQSVRQRGIQTNLDGRGGIQEWNRILTKLLTVRAMLWAARIFLNFK